MSNYNFMPGPQVLGAGLAAARMQRGNDRLRLQRKGKIKEPSSTGTSCLLLEQAKPVENPCMLYQASDAASCNVFKIPH